MKITHQIKIDMTRRGVTPVVDAVQGDTGTRFVDISLFANNVKWDIPAETLFLVKYRREDGTGGTYDTLPDGSLACSIIGNTVSVVLVSPILSKSGIVETQIEMNNGENVLSVFTFFINVQRDPAYGADIAEDDYVNIQTFIKSEVETALTAAKESGEFDGPPGPSGIHVGPNEPKDPDINVWIDTDEKEGSYILISPSGKKFKLTVDDNGNILTAELSE